MKKIIGQDKILSQIDTFTLDTMPRSIILTGALGSGKHLICEYISNKFNLELIDISDRISLETLDEISCRVEPYLYLINSMDITVAEQNMLLKFVEEPLKNAYIIILSENLVNLLITVQNRCTIMELSRYTSEVLGLFIGDDANRDILEICAETPGQVELLKSLDLQSTQELADKIIDKIEVARFFNALKISSVIAYKGEQDKIDLFALARLIIYGLLGRLHKCHDEKLLEYYKITNELSNKLQHRKDDKKYLFENYLTRLWGVTHRQ